MSWKMKIKILKGMSDDQNLDKLKKFENVILLPTWLDGPMRVKLS